MGSFAASSYSLCSLQGTEGTASQRGSGLPVCCWKVADLLKSTNVKVLLCKSYILKCQGVALPCQPNASLCHKRTASCLTAFQVWMGQLLFIFFALCCVFLNFILLLSFGEGMPLVLTSWCISQLHLENHWGVGGVSNLIGRNPWLLQALIQSDAHTHCSLFFQT